MSETQIFEETRHSEQLNELLAALSKAQSEISPAMKDKSNPYFKSKYADLTSIWEACRQPLSKNGLCVLQTVEGNKSDMFLVTWLGHSSGQWIRSKLPIFLVKQDPQSQGSAITYARRYALSAMVGVSADDDDDGEKAMDRKDTKKKEGENVKELTDNLNSFLSCYPKEEHSLIKSYFSEYSKLWKKSVSESVEAASNKKEKFEADFTKWKTKNVTVLHEEAA